MIYQIFWLLAWPVFIIAAWILTRLMIRKFEFNR